MSKAKRSRTSSLPRRHEPLHEQIEQDYLVKSVSSPSSSATAASSAYDNIYPMNNRDRKRARANNQQNTSKKRNDMDMSGDDDDEMEQTLVSEKISRKILEQAREQQEEIENEERDPTLQMRHSVAKVKRRQDAPSNFLQNSRVISSVRRKNQHHDDDDDDEDDGDYNVLGTSLDYQHDVEEELRNISKEDERVLKMFMPSKSEQRQTLADIIREKMEQKEEELTAIASSAGGKSTQRFNPKIVEVYTQVGLLLSRYRSGKLPKAFKLVPTMADWEDILYFTNPAEWSAQATYQATRIFASNFNPKMAQRFYNLVLLPKVRDDFQRNKTLNYHLYMALKKSLYKPAAFFKGILLPLCESGTCTLQEAAIIASILKKVSIPILHSSAALLKLAEMEYTGTNSIFLRVLLDKKYALPYRVIDALVFHFLSFENDQRQMPVLWHQAFLVFVQRYKEDMTPEQKDALRNLLKKQFHDKISPEIRREIDNSKCRGDVMNEEQLMQIEMAQRQREFMDL